MLSHLSTSLRCRPAAGNGNRFLSGWTLPRQDMRLIRYPSLLPLLFPATIWAANWDAGLNADIEGDIPAPTLDPFVSNVYPYFSLGSIPLHRGIGRSKNATHAHSGRLDYRQTVRGPSMSDEWMGVHIEY